MTDYKHIYSKRLKSRDSAQAFLMLAILLIAMGVCGYIENNRVDIFDAADPVVMYAKDGR